MEISNEANAPIITHPNSATVYKDKVKVAAVQAAPIPFDCQATTDKACRLIHEAARQGARLVLLPEAFIPAYPHGLAFGTVVGSRTLEGRRTWERYWASAVDVPGPITDTLGAACREAGVYLAIGVVERDSQFSGGTLYCTLLYFGPDGRLLGKHRKLKPTAAERILWGEGDGSTLTVVPTEFGRVGGLICWENYMPLARMAMYGKGVDIYLAPTADARDTWHSTLQHIACEGRCFVLGCNQFVTRSMYPADMPESELPVNLPEILSRGGSAIISPLGETLAGPLYNEEGMLLCELDMTEIPRSRFDFDVTGHYARPDVFQLRVNEQSMPPVLYSAGQEPKPPTRRDLMP